MFPAYHRKLSMGEEAREESRELDLLFHRFVDVPPMCVKAGVYALMGALKLRLCFLEQYARL